MTEVLRLLALLSSLILVLGCSELAEQDALTSQTLGQQSEAPTDTLHYFTTSPSGARSVLWRGEAGVPTTGTGTLRRTRLAVVEHASGYAPRGAISASGRLGWVTLPTDRRHGNPGEVWLDGKAIDERALYLQTPLFVGEAFFYLRQEPGPERFGSNGRLLQTKDEFELVRIDASGREDILHTEVALWLHLVGRLPGKPDHLLVQRVRDDGSHLLVFEPEGRLVATHFLGAGAVRDLHPDPSRPGWVTYLESQGGPQGSRVLEMNLRGPSTASATAVSHVRQDQLSPYAAPLPLRSGSILITSSDPATEEFRVPLFELDRGHVLWREHSKTELTYVLLGSEGQRTRLVPPGDAAQDVSLLRSSR